MAWFKRESGELDTSGKKTVRTEGLWVKCENCRQIIWKKDLEDNLNVCPKCEKHFRIDARTRLALLLDENEYETFDGDLSSTDPLKFVDLKPYSSRLRQAQNDTGLKDAVINAQGMLLGRPVIASAMEYAFIGGSMGAVVGEMITRAVERALDSKTPTLPRPSSHLPGPASPRPPSQIPAPSASSRICRRRPTPHPVPRNAMSLSGTAASAPASPGPRRAEPSPSPQSFSLCPAQY